MTGKRFYLKQNHIIDSESKLMNMEQLLSYSEVVDLLNNLTEENKQLKEKNEELLAKLKYTCKRINYSERLKEMMK